MTRKAPTPIATKRTRTHRATRREAGAELLQVWLDPLTVKALARLTESDSKTAVVNRLITEAANRSKK